MHNDIEPHKLADHVLHDLYANDSGTIPDRIRLIVTAVDVQDGHVHCLQVGFADGMEIFILHQAELLMDTTQAQSFEAINEYVNSRVYRTDAGRSLVSDYVFIDSRFRTEAVYKYFSQNPQFRYAITGHGETSRPIFDVPKYRREKNAYQLKVGGHQGKDYMASRWGAEQKTIYIAAHPAVNNNRTFEQLTGEVRRSRQVNGRKQFYWKPRTASQRVEALDCLNYAISGAMMLATYSPSVMLDMSAPIKFQLQKVDGKDGEFQRYETTTTHDPDHVPKAVTSNPNNMTLQQIMARRKAVTG